MKLSKRLAALEASVIDTSKNDGAAAFAERLKDFIDGVFPTDQYTCRMDHVARCCGLPGSRSMRAILQAKFSEDAFRSEAHSAYGDDWSEQMVETMEASLDRVCDVHGDDGPMLLAKAFPGVLVASKVAFAEMTQ